MVSCVGENVCFNIDHNLVRIPIMFESYLVAKLCPAESLTWTMWNDPGCFSNVVIVPTRPMLCPPVIIHKLPVIEHKTSKMQSAQVITAYYFVVVIMCLGNSRNNNSSEPSFVCTMPASRPDKLESSLRMWVCVVTVDSNTMIGSREIDPQHSADIPAITGFV